MLLRRYHTDGPDENQGSQDTLAPAEVSAEEVTVETGETAKEPKKPKGR